MALNMGFNPYVSTSPYYPQYPQNNAQAQNGSNVGWVYVNGIEGARSQIVQPGCTAWMMDNSDPRIYVKSVDVTGTVTLKGFQLEEIPTAVSGNSPAAFASANDLAALTARIETLEKEIGGLNG